MGPWSSINTSAVSNILVGRQYLGSYQAILKLIADYHILHGNQPLSTTFGVFDHLFYSYYIFVNILYGPGRLAAGTPMGVA